jgi:hypothetical protein
MPSREGPIPNFFSEKNIERSNSFQARGWRQSNRIAQIQSAAGMSVITTNHGSLNNCDPSIIARQICAIVSNPKTTPVTIKYAFIAVFTFPF